MEKQNPNILQTDFPDEIIEVNRPEIGETTPHPDTPQPQAGMVEKSTV
jgi:hypothetical protein